MSLDVTQIDVRAIAPVDRHPILFSTFSGLADGQIMELVNDHDPRPLRQQFDARWPGRFDWTYLEQGPSTWRVAIARRAAAGQCCGSCGGA